MKHKRLDHKNTGWRFEQHPYYQMRVDIEEFHGLVGLIKFIGRKRLYWGKIPVAGKGMIWLQLIPDEKKRVITAKYIPKKKTIQGVKYPNSVSLWYVDIIENIEYDTDGVAVFIDKYIDVIFTPQGDDIKIDDRHELDAAYQSGELSKEQYDSALRECDLIVDELCSDVEKTEIMCSTILSYVNDRIEKGEKPFKEKSR